MTGETVITVIGNLTADPELRFTSSGVAVANFTVASTPRTFDKNTNEWKDGEALFLRCSIWRQAAENVAESLTRGARVIVSGRLKQRSFETREGEKRTVVELEVEEHGPQRRGSRRPRRRVLAVGLVAQRAVRKRACVLVENRDRTRRRGVRERPRAIHERHLGGVSAPRVLPTAMFPKRSSAGNRSDR